MLNPVQQTFRNSRPGKAWSMLQLSIPSSAVWRWAKKTPQQIDLLEYSFITRYLFNFLEEITVRIKSLKSADRLKKSVSKLVSGFHGKPVLFFSIFGLAFISANTVSVLLKGTNLFEVTFRLILLAAFIAGLWIKVDLATLLATSRIFDLCKKTTLHHE